MSKNVEIEVDFASLIPFEEEQKSRNAQSVFRRLETATATAPYDPLSGHLMIDSRTYTDGICMSH